VAPRPAEIFCAIQDPKHCRYTATHAKHAKKGPRIPRGSGITWPEPTGRFPSLLRGEILRSWLSSRSFRAWR